MFLQIVALKKNVSHTRNVQNSLFLQILVLKKNIITYKIKNSNNPKTNPIRSQYLNTNLLDEVLCLDRLTLVFDSAFTGTSATAGSTLMKIHI